MTRRDIEAGLADWSEKVAGAKQFGIHLEKRERERADAARGASEPSVKAARRLGSTARRVLRLAERVPAREWENRADTNLEG